MARAISPHGRYEIQLIESPVKRGLDQSGNVVEYTEGKPINAQFEKAGLTDWEQLAALEHFNFSGLPEGVFPLTTVSVWDSEAQAIQQGWSPEFHEQIEARLRQLASLNPGSILVVDTPAKQSPWNKYDEQDVRTIFRLFSETGADPEVVRLYEFENKARPEIIDACEKIAAGETTIEAYLDSGLKTGANDGEAPLGSGLVQEGVAGFVPSGPPVAEVTFPHNSSPGRWTLSNGEKIQGTKDVALAAEAALTTLPPLAESVIVNA